MAANFLKDLAGRNGSALERKLGIVAALFFIELVYLWIVTAGTWTVWPWWGVYHDYLADGFRAGHLYVVQPPNPALLLKKDPYDQVNSALWMGDLSLWKNHYYLYWGPVPAAFQAVAKEALGIHRAIGDQYLAFASVSIAGLSGALLVVRLATRLFPAVPFAVLILSMLAVAFANPVLHTLATGGVYQVAITSAQAFLVLGFWLSFEAILAQRHSWAWLLSASVCFGLAIGCRVSIAPAVGLVALLAGLLAPSPVTRSWRSVSAALASALIPLGASAAALLYYNWARFENPLEFGTNIQTGFFKFTFSAKYLLTNVFTYLGRPPTLSCHFPYVFQAWYPTDPGVPFEPPEGYLVNEPVVGLLLAAPIVLVAPFAFARIRRFRLGPLSSPVRANAFVLGAFLSCMLTALIIPLGLYMATMRYQGDVVFAAVLLGIVGTFSLWNKRDWLYRGLRIVAVYACLHTVAFGLALGYQGYGGQVYVHNRELDRTLRHALSICGNTPSRVPHFIPAGVPKMD